MDISNNAADFSKSLLELADYTTGSVEKVIRKSCIDLYRAIVEKTPVDTGRAKASWGLSTNHAEDVQGDSGGYSFNEIEGIIKENVSDFKFDIHDDEVVIYNNLEYISELEDGTSQQAPTGMVAISLAEFTAFFNEALSGLDGLS
jgi:hypothetical protein